MKYVIFKRNNYRNDDRKIYSKEYKIQVITTVVKSLGIIPTMLCQSNYSRRNNKYI